MATGTFVSNVGAKAMCDALTALLDAGGAGTLQIYDVGGGVPADCDVAISDQTLLAELTLSATAFGAAADATPGAVCTAAAITDDTSADATGTAAFFRAANNAGTAVIQGTCGTSGADMNLDSLSIVAGGTVSISSWTFTVPESA